jgi:hypothetical protein
MARTAVPRVFRSILCPVDFSNNSRAALRYAAMLARLSDAAPARDVHHRIRWWLPLRRRGRM